LFAINVVSSFFKVGDVYLYILFPSLEQFFFYITLMMACVKVLDKAGILWDKEISHSCYDYEDSGM
jgi:hypothetical protein